MTLLIPACIYFDLPKDGLGGLCHAVISIPALVALHLYIWDKKVFSVVVWKFYAIGFFVWEVVWLLVFVPLNSGEPLNPRMLAGYGLLLPYYIALFRYAFRH